jgi:thiol-disulfide isomerase/thioredoxin
LYTRQVADTDYLSSQDLAQAVGLLESGAVDKAISALQRVIRSSPGIFMAHLRLAQAYHLKSVRGDRIFQKLTEKECAEALRLAPAEQEAHEQLVAIAVKLGLGDDLLVLYRTRFNGLPFADACVAAIREANPDEAGDFVAGIVKFLKRESRKIVTLLVLAGVGWWIMSRPPAVTGTPSTRNEFALKDLDGTEVRLSDFLGTRVVVLDFFATWCGPCRASMPVLNELKKKYSGSVEFFTIDLQEPVETVRGFMASQGLSLHVLLDSSGAVARQYGVRGIPAMFVIDKKGEIVRRFVGWGGNSAGELEEVLKLLQ